MHNRLVTGSLVAAAVVSGCTAGDLLAPDQFRVVGVVTTHLAADTTTCTLTWKSQVNDVRLPYTFGITIAGDTGTVPDTAFMVASENAGATGPVTVEGTFRKPDVLVGWQFSWDTLTARDSAHVKACVVQ